MSDESIMPYGVHKGKQMAEETNLELFKQITFSEFIQHGRGHGANIVNGMPWSWKINGKSVTHENDNCYLIETKYGIEKFEPGQHIYAIEDGLLILLEHHNTHSPGGCPM